jgi:hypothetical protein
LTYLLQNFAYCALTADVDDTVTTFSVDETSRVPPNDQLGSPFLMTVESTFVDGAFEIVRVTHKSTDSGAGDLTVSRAQDNSTAFAHTTGTMIKGAVTAGILAELYDLISSSMFMSLFVGEWGAGTGYAPGAIVTFRGGLYGTQNGTTDLESDPLTPSNYQPGNSFLTSSSDGGAASNPLSGQDRGAQGFQLSSDATIYGVLLECTPGTLGTYQGNVVNVGIASDLGAGTPVFVTEKAWTITDDDVAQDSIKAIFDAPVDLTASTQYYIVVIGDSGDTNIPGLWIKEPTADLVMFHGPGVITDSTYDAFTDATFSTNLTGERFWCFMVDSLSNDWTEILPPPVQVYDTLPSPDETIRGKLAILQQSGVEDILQVCLRNSDGSSYGWFEIVRGDAIVDLGVTINGVATVTGTMTAGGAPISTTPPSDSYLDAPYLDSTSGSSTFDLSAYTPNATDPTEDGSPWDDFHDSVPTARAPKSAWAKYICTVSGTATFDTIGSGYDTFLRVVDASGTEIGFDDDGGSSHGGSGGESWVQVSVTAGTTYYIRPSPFPSSSNGSGTLLQQASTHLNWSTPG